MEPRGYNTKLRKDVFSLHLSTQHGTVTSGGQTSNGFSSICALAQATVERPFGVGKAKPQGHQQMLVPRAAPPASAPEQTISPNATAEDVRMVVKEKGNENGLLGLNKLYL